jgi:hypothetical protein
MRTFIALICSFPILALAVPAPMPPVPSGRDAKECREAADMIANVARSRDNRIPLAVHIDHLERDAIILAPMPAEQRWFIHTDADVEFLRQEMHLVYEKPLSPEKHHAAALERCLRG